jgi:hypothetical protein
MKKEFIPNEQTLKLKELGFDEDCVGYYDGLGNPMVKPMKHCPISAPLYQQAFKFFREKYNLECSISRMPPQIVIKSQASQGKIKKYLGFIWCEFSNPRGEASIYTDTYEEAELECLKKLIEIVEQQKK